MYKVFPLCYIKVKLIYITSLLLHFREWLRQNWIVDQEWQRIAINAVSFLWAEVHTNLYIYMIPTSIKACFIRPQFVSIFTITMIWTHCIFAGWISRTYIWLNTFVFVICTVWATVPMTKADTIAVVTRKTITVTVIGTLFPPCTIFTSNSICNIM